MNVSWKRLDAEKIHFIQREAASLESQNSYTFLFKILFITQNAFFIQIPCRSLSRHVHELPLIFHRQIPFIIKFTLTSSWIFECSRTVQSCNFIINTPRVNNIKHKTSQKFFKMSFEFLWKNRWSFECACKVLNNSVLLSSRAQFLATELHLWRIFTILNLQNMYRNLLLISFIESNNSTKFFDECYTNQLRRTTVAYRTMMTTCNFRLKYCNCLYLQWKKLMLQSFMRPRSMNKLSNHLQNRRAWSHLSRS